MSQPSPTYLRRMEQWLMGGVSLEKMNMSVVQRYRAKLVYEAYIIWQQDKMINPADVLRRIAAREYAISLQRANMGDADAKADVDALNIRQGVPRTVSEISKDVYVLNWMVQRFNTSTRDIDKAKVQASADWLMREGMKTRNDRAVTNGAKLYMELNQNFNEKENPVEQMPNTNMNITGDISIVKSDRVNLTEEQRKSLARRYGLTAKEVKDLREQEDGSFAVVDDADENDKEDEMSPDFEEENKD